MVSRNNLKNKMEAEAKRVPHWSLRKLSVGVASVLLGTTLFFGMGTVANADTTANAQNASTEMVGDSLSQNGSSQADSANESTQTVNVSSANANTNVNQLTASLAATPNSAPASANNELHAIWNNTIKYQYATSDSPEWQSNGQLKPQRSGAAADPTIFHLDATNVHSGSDRPVVTEQGNIIGTPTLVGNPVDPYHVTGHEEIPLDTSRTYVKFVYDVPVQQDFGASYIGPSKLTSILYADKTNGTLTFVSPESTNTIDVYQIGFKTKIHYHGDGYDQTFDGPTIYADGKVANIEYHIPNGYALSDARQLTQLSETMTNDGGRYSLSPRPNGNGFAYAKDSNGQNLIGLVNIDVPLQKLQAASVTYQFVDDNNNGANVGKAHNVSGYVGKSANVSLTIPENYQLATGQSLPTSVNFEQEGNTQVKIHLVHQTEPVPSTDPSLNREIVRTININNPITHETTTKTQRTTLHRTGTKDKVTGQITYSAWGNGSWESYTLPTVAGYVPNQTISTVSAPTSEATVTNRTKAPVVASQTVTDEIGAETVDVNYTPVDQSGKISYVDPEGNEVDHTPLNGKTGEEVTVTPQIPAGWKEVPGQDVPGTVTVKADGIPTVTIKVEHATTTVQPTDPKTPDDTLPDNPGKKYPSGVDETDLNKTIVRTIIVHTPGEAPSTVRQEAKLTRTATVDEVNGNVTYSDWNNGSWDKYNVPTVPGYTPSTNVVESANVTSETQPATVDVTYTSTAQTGKISYVDPEGNEVTSTPLTGNTGEEVTVTPQIPAGWKEVPGQNIPGTVTATTDGVPTVTVKIEHATTTVQPTDPKTPADTLPDNPGKKYPSGVAKDDLNKTVTRTINVHKPDGTTTTETQTAKLSRTATVDEVTGDVTYNDWSNGSWDAYNVPTIQGYTPSQSVVEAQTVTGNTKDQTVNVTYNATQQNGEIVYVDKDGKTIPSTPLTGKTGETIKVVPQIPAGYKIVPGQQIPKTVTATAEGIPTVTIQVEHAMTTVQPTDPKTPADTLPDNPGKKYPSGVAKDDLNKTVTRTINVTKPDGTVTTKVQTSQSTRTATVDEVTGEVTYSQWQNGEWQSYTAPTVAGYTPTQAVVPTVVADANNGDQIIEIRYNPDAQTATVNYIDQDNGNTIVGTQTITGPTDSSYSFVDHKSDLKVPAGYEIVSLPGTYHFKASGNQPVNVILKHKIVSVTDQSQLHREVTRTIKVVDSTGHELTNLEPQIPESVTFDRTGTKDLATGKVTYTDWTPSDSFVFPAYKPTNEDGYTIRGFVPEITVTPSSNSTTVYLHAEKTRDDLTTVQYVLLDNNNQPVTTLKSITKFEAHPAGMPVSYRQYVLNTITDKDGKVYNLTHDVSGVTGYGRINTDGVAIKPASSFSGEEDTTITFFYKGSNSATPKTYTIEYEINGQVDNDLTKNNIPATGFNENAYKRPFIFKNGMHRFSQITHEGNTIIYHYN